MSLELGRRRLVEILTKSSIVSRVFDAKYFSSPLPKHVNMVAARSFFLSYIHDGALIHLFVRYDLEPKSTQLSERLPGNASYSAGGIVRLTLTERIRFRYVRLRALEGNRFYRFSPDPRNSAKISTSRGLSLNTSLQSGRHYEVMNNSPSSNSLRSTLASHSHLICSPVPLSPPLSGNSECVCRLHILHEKALD